MAGFVASMREHIPGPMLKAIVPSVMAMGAGDCICQRLEKKEGWDKERTLRMMTAGFLVVSPLHYTLFVQYERFVPGQHMAAALKKTVLNGVCSILVVVANFSANTFLEGQGTTALGVKLENRLLPTCTAGLAFWPAINLLLFRYLPLPKRPFFGSLAGMVWNVFLSFKVNAPLEQPTPPFPLPVVDTTSSMLLMQAGSSVPLPPPPVMVGAMQAE